jgi:uncharacterized protein
VVTRDLYFRVILQAENTPYDLSKDLTSFTVEEDDRMADKLTVIVPDPLKVFSFAIREGMEVEVDLGYADDHSILFRGLVTQVDSSFPEDGIPSVTVVAYDNIIRMGLKRRHRPWTDIDLRSIISQIATEHQFTSQQIELPDGGNPTYEGNGVRQREQTDLAFLHELANAQHCKVFVECEDKIDVFNFKAEKFLMDADPATALHYRCVGAYTNLLKFSVSSDINNRRRRRVYATVNPESGEPVDAQREAEPARELESGAFDESLTEFRRRDPARADSLTQLIDAADAAYQSIVKARGEEEREITTGLHSSQQLRQRTAPQASTSNEGMTGSGVAEGDKDMRAKRNILIEDVGGRFSGKWYLSKIRHVVDGSGYRTHFICSR